MLNNMSESEVTRVHDGSTCASLLAPVSPAIEDLQAVLDAVPALILELDADGCVHAVHGSDRRMLSTSPDSLSKKGASEILPSAAAQAIQRALREAATMGGSNTGNFTLHEGEGARDFELHVSARECRNDASRRYLVIVRDVTERMAAEPARLGAERLSALQEERDRLLADLHDGLGTQLTITRLRAERGTMGQEQMVDALNAILADLHMVVDTLRDPEDSLANALVDFRLRCERRISGASPRITWNLSVADAPQLSARSRLHVLRIVQEALANALRHSLRGQIIVTATYDRCDGIVIRVCDDGVGLPDEVVPGRGLYNMKRRAREIGADLTIANRVPPPGVEVVLRLPLSAEGGGERVPG